MTDSTELATMSKTENNAANSCNDEGGDVLLTKKRMIIPFMITLILGSLHVGFSMASANQLAALFNAKYGWVTPADKSLNQSLIGSSVVVGLSCGALSGGKIISIGRRKTQIIFNVIGMVGVAMCLVQNF